MTPQSAPGEAQALPELLRIHGRADDLNALAADKKRLKASEREAIEAIQEVAMKAAARIAELEAALLTTKRELSLAEDAAAGLEAEVRRLRPNAERYEWLRARPEPLGYMQTARALGLDLSRTSLDTPEKLDAAIDAARQETPNA